MSGFEPPPAAVAADPHWAAKIARMRDRKPLEKPVTLHDEEAARAVARAEGELALAETEARAEAIEDLGSDMPRELLIVQVADKVSADQRVIDARKAVEDARAEQEALDVDFIFRGLPGDVWEDLVHAHPPTEVQAKRGEGYNQKTFAPAAIAACSVKPLTVEDVMTFWPNLSQGEQALLFTTVITVNQSARASMGKGSGPTAT